MAICDQSISVVIQGPVVGGSATAPDVCSTAAVVASVRRFLPKAEVILSTWEGTSCDHLPVDIVVTSKDPGAYPVNNATGCVQYNNLNRMLVSTAAGLEQCGRPFSIKLRTDTPLRSAPDYAAIPPVSCEPSFRFFERRILVPNIYTRNPLKRPVLFHLSDLVQFGTTTDLRTLWCIPLVDEPAFTQWTSDTYPLPCNAYPEVEYHCRCSPEQYLVESLVRRKHAEVFLTHPADGRLSWLFLWLRLLATHFVVEPYTQFFAVLPARMTEHAQAFDLIAAADLPWLSRWNRFPAPVGLRVNAMTEYAKARCRYTKPSRLRSFGRAVRRTLKRLIADRCVNEFLSR